MSGKRCSLDVATISQGETRFFSVLTLAWGMSDIHLIVLNFKLVNPIIPYILC